MSDPGRHIVAVDGLDGSGKSKLGDALAEACAAAGTPALLLHVDDGKRALDFTGLGEQAEGALYYDRYYDFDAVEQRLASFEQGIAIVEGVFCLRVPAVAASAGLIVLTVSAQEAQRRILERDRSKGRTDQEINRRIDRRYFPGPVALPRRTRSDVARVRRHRQRRLAPAPHRAPRARQPAGAHRARPRRHAVGMI